MGWPQFCQSLVNGLYTWLYNNIPVNHCQVFRDPSVFYFSDNSLIFMLFFVFLPCIAITVIVFQVRSLMDTRLLNFSAS